MLKDFFLGSAHSITTLTSGIPVTAISDAAIIMKREYKNSYEGLFEYDPLTF